MKLFGRDPALLWQAVAVAMSLLFSFGVPLNDMWQTAINGLILAAWGVVTAVSVQKEKIVPAVAGLIQAVAVLAAGFSLHVSPEQQSLAIMLFGLLFAFFTRTQVVAPLDENGLRRTATSTEYVSGPTPNIVRGPVNPPSGV